MRPVLAPHLAHAKTSEGDLVQGGFWSDREMAGGEQGAGDFMDYPSEVLNRAANVFGVGGYMLSQRLLHRLGLIVSLMDDDLQSIALSVKAGPLASNSVGSRNPIGKLGAVD